MVIGQTGSGKTHTLTGPPELVRIYTIPFNHYNPINNEMLSYLVYWQKA